MLELYGKRQDVIVVAPISTTMKNMQQLRKPGIDFISAQQAKWQTKSVTTFTEGQIINNLREVGTN